MSETLRQKSKEEFIATGNNLLNIEAGCFQRMADSLERMEKPYLKLLNDVTYLQSRVKYLNNENARLTKSRSALKGVITKLRKGGNK